MGRSPPLSSSPTTPCSPPTLSSSTPTSLSCLTTRPSTTSAVALLTSSAPPTPTSTVSWPRSSLPSPLPSVSTVPSTSTSPSSRPTSSPTPYPLYALLLRPRHLCREGLPRAALRRRDHQLCLRACLHDGQVRPPPRQVHGLLPHVPW